MKIIYSILTVFILLSSYSYWLINSFITKSETSYTNSVKEEIQILINSQLSMTYELAKAISINKKIIHTLQQGNYERFYKDNFFTIPEEYKKFQTIDIHIVDAQGRQAYLSWAGKEKLYENVFDARKDLKLLYTNPHPTKLISVGKFDITLKGIAPIYTKDQRFLGVVEVITHFNNITNRLRTYDIYSLVLADKKFKKQLKYAYTGKFIDGYYVSNHPIEPKIEKVAKKYGIENLIKLKSFTYVHLDHILEGCYVISIPIYGINNEVIGYYLAFIQDNEHLFKLETIFYLNNIILILLFLIMTYLVFKKYKENRYLIENLQTEVKKQVLKNKELLYKDNITTAYSRIKLLEDIQKPTKKYIIMLNIKNFSKINEEYGFDVGDGILKSVVRVIQQELFKKIYRMDIDEFIIFSDDPQKEIKNIKQTFLEKPIHLQKHDVKLRLSFSYAVAPSNTNEVLQKLSITMKIAKKEPYKLYVMYKPVKTNHEFSHFNTLLYDALFFQEQANIVPYAQKIINNKTQEVQKYEILARLETKDTTYTPYHFLRIAKSSGFLYDLTKKMIEETFQIIHTHKKSINISLNITEDDLLVDEFEDFLITKYKQYNIDPSTITLEILEGITSTGAKNNIDKLNRLKKHGFLIAIDDFGVEYSNFERIKDLDIDFIKIDGKYTKEITTNKKSLTIVKAITSFAHSMNIKVIAEFVENETIFNTLKEMEVDASQGYYFHKPEKLNDILRNLL